MQQERTDKITKVLALVAERGGWSNVYSRYSGLLDAMNRFPRQVPCPMSGEGRTKFRLYRDWEVTGGGYHEDFNSCPGGIDVIAMVENCSKGKALDIIIDICGGNLARVTNNYIKKINNTPKGLSEEEKELRRTKLRKVQQAAFSASKSTAVEVYLRSRGLKGDMKKLPSSLGFVSELWWGDGRSKPIKACGMLGLMTDVNGKAVTIHRTFLDPSTNKKLDVETPKMVMQPPTYMGGCSIKLDKPKTFYGETVIGLAEGIETALAVREATGLPMWSTYSSTLMQMVNIPKDVSVVFIFADKDRFLESGKGEAGQRAATVLAEKLRLEGKTVHILIPDDDIIEGSKSVDWLDVYNKHGADGFPCGHAGLVDTGLLPKH